MQAMPPRSRLKLPPLDLGHESLGERLTRLRKERGYTQVELAGKIGIIQEIVSNYERDRLRMHAEMVARFAQALGVSADALIGLKLTGDTSRSQQLPKRVVRRVEQIAKLPSQDQRALLKTIDAFLRAQDHRRASA